MKVSFKTAKKQARAFLSCRGHGIGGQWRRATWDPGILRDLKAINRNPDLITTASCSGMHPVGPTSPDAGAFLAVRIKNRRLVPSYVKQLRKTKIPVRFVPEKQNLLMVGWGRHTSPEEASYFWEEVPKALRRLDV